jgi:GWxTD domain-containing protein
MRCRTRKLVVALLLLGPVASLPLEAKRDRKPQRAPDSAEVTNFRLGLDYSHWLVGPIYYIASEEERRNYLALSSDADAEAYIEAFWSRRNPAGSDFFGNDLRRLYEERLAEADKRYREGVTLGRRTDRGVIYVVYGEPESVEYDVSVRPREPDLEVWVYPKDSETGLNGEQPKRRYWFAEKDGRVVLHTPKPTRRSSIVERRN